MTNSALQVLHFRTLTSTRNLCFSIWDVRTMHPTKLSRIGILHLRLWQVQLFILSAIPTLFISSTTPPAIYVQHKKRAAAPTLDAFLPSLQLLSFAASACIPDLHPSLLALPFLSLGICPCWSIPALPLLPSQSLVALLTPSLSCPTPGGFA